MQVPIDDRRRVVDAFAVAAATAARAAAEAPEAARVEAEMDKEGDISVPENGNYVQRRKKENKKEVKNKPGRNVMMVKEQNKECCNQDMSAKEIAIITGSAVASALALIVSVGAIMLVNKTK